MVRPKPSDPIEGVTYLHTLAAYVRQHEDKLADFVRRKPPPTAPSWTTILTMGIVSSDVPVIPKAPLVLKFDPHHLYYLLLKFDEAGVGGSGGIGSLDCLIDGGPTRPMSINYGTIDQPSFLGIDTDAVSFQSTFSSVSTFSLSSGWWGSSAPKPDVTIDVKYLYSSCTKLPALRLVPYTFSPGNSPSPSAFPALSQTVKDFEDCPPPNTAVPLYAFKNLQSLVLEDLDPRAFLGWDVLSTQLRSLEVRRSGIEDIGELLCDSVVEDVERRKKGRGAVGEERRRRQGASSAESDVTEAAANLPTPPAESETPPSGGSTSPTLDPSMYPVPPPASWSRLRHLCLASNSLTFVPSSPLIHLSVLTSLDLSSNLLIAVPVGLAHLHSLRSLNLSDNMIDSLLGISKALGNVAVVNLSKNRIDNLSGLDRLFALERLDLRDNWVKESLEVSRLATLPCLKEVWIEGNTFTKPVLEGGEENYRVKCFNYFVKEGKGEEVLLDGTLPGMNERRGIEQLNETSRGGGRGRLGLGGRRASAQELRGEAAAATTGEAKVVGRRVVTTPHASSRYLKTQGVDGAGVGEALPSTSPSKSPSITPKKGLKPKKRKPQRIVDLDAPAFSAATSMAGDFSGTEGGGGPTDPESSPQLAPTRVGGSGHVRYPTSPSASSRGLPSSEGRPLLGGREGSVSLGHSTTKSTRRDRVSASTFEPPTGGHTSGEDDGFGPRPKAAETSADAFRKKIEALRSEVGESWLSVLGEREMAAERTKNSQSESGSGTEGLAGAAKAKPPATPAAGQPSVTSTKAAGPASGAAPTAPLNAPEVETSTSAEITEREEEAAEVVPSVTKPVVVKKKAGKGKKKKRT